MALTQIEGDSSGDVRDAVAEALEGKELALIGSKEVNRAVDKLGDLADLTEKDFKKLANDLEADAIVLGKLDKVGGSKTLKFRLFVHKKMAKGFTVSFKDPKSEKFRSLLHDKMIDKIGAAAGAGEDDRPAKKKASDEDDEALASKKEPKGKKAGKKAKASEDEEEARPAKKKVADEEEARPAKKAKVADDEDAKPAKKAKVADDEDAKPAKKKVADDDDTRSARSEAPAEDARRASDDEDAPRKAKKKVAAAEEGDDGDASVSARVEGPRGANRVAIRVDLGASVVQRTFKFNSANIPERPKNPPLSPVPGARIEAEIYPLGMSGSRGALAGLGLGAEYDKTISLNLTTQNEPGVTVPVKQSHYSFGARYRMVFGATETSPTLTLGVGYGKRLFSPDRSKLTMDAARNDIARDTPNVNYTVIDPGLMFRFPVTRMVALSAGGRGMIIPNAGAIQNASSYGRGRVYGFEGIAAVDVVLGSHLALRFAGEFVQVGFSFQGVGALSNNLDGNTETKDVGGLADRSLGGSATLAVLY